MDEEFKNRLEERWLDHQVALNSTIAALKADPANRYALVKAWAVFVAKISLHSLVGSAAFCSPFTWQWPIPTAGFPVQ